MTLSTSFMQKKIVSRSKIEEQISIFMKKLANNASKQIFSVSFSKKW